MAENPKSTKSGPVTKADHEHVAAIEAGNQSSWGKLYQRHYEGVLRFCGHFTADAQLAEEWTQETFLRLREKAHTFKAGAAVKPWLYKVARNIGIEYRRKFREAAWSDSVFAKREANFASLSSTPSAKHSAHERIGLTKKALAGMSEDHRTTLLLRYIDGLSPSEIADVMGVPLGTAKSRLRDGLNELRLRLKEKA